jgi:hypothetical protein
MASGSGAPATVCFKTSDRSCMDAEDSKSPFESQDVLQHLSHY